MLIHLKATPILETYSCNFIRIDYNRFDEMSSEKKVFFSEKRKKIATPKEWSGSQSDLAVQIGDGDIGEHLHCQRQGLFTRIEIRGMQRIAAALSVPDAQPDEGTLDLF